MVPLLSSSIQLTTGIHSEPQLGQYPARGRARPSEWNGLKGQRGVLRPLIPHLLQLFKVTRSGLRLVVPEAEVRGPASQLLRPPGPHVHIRGVSEISKAGFIDACANRFLLGNGMEDVLPLVNPECCPG